MTFRAHYDRRCPRVFDNRKGEYNDNLEPRTFYTGLPSRAKEEKQAERKYQAKGPAQYLLCRSTMNRVYIRDVEPEGYNYEKRRSFAPLGVYCKYCGLFCIDEEYPNLRDKQYKISDPGSQYHWGYYQK